MSIRVLIVDDSALVRQMLTHILDNDPEIEVVGAAADPYIARRKIKQLHPDVLTLDVEMPRMNGITFLENLMRLRPMPVVMVSSVTEKGADVTLKALELGAVDYILKPKVNVADGLQEYAEEIVAKVKVAYEARVRTQEEKLRSNKNAEQACTADAIKNISERSQHRQVKNHVIGLGASTGGTEAIADVLRYLPSDMPGIVVTQHIPGPFSKSFARRVNGYCQLEVVEAQDGEMVARGRVYIAPGDRHLEIVKDGGSYICKLNDGPLVNRHKPAVDVLFNSLAKSAGQNAIGVLMTGMGKDGAVGLAAMKKSGGITLVQDERSSVVWGMPKEAIRLGIVDEIVALQSIPRRLIELSE